MQVPDTPPEVAEGEARDDADVVRLIAVALQMAAIANNTAASTAPPWTIATAPRWVEATTGQGAGVCVPDSLPPTLLSNRNRCLRAITEIPASSPSSMTCFSRPR